MTPGSALLRALTIAGGCAVLVAVLPVVLPLVVIAAAALLAMAMVEALQLRRVEIVVDRPRAIAFYLDEVEHYALRVVTSAPFPVQIEIRQRWPELVEQRSSTAIAICRPGESVQFDFPLHTIQRGVAAVEPPSFRFTRRHFVERILHTSGASEMAVTPNIAAVARLHRQLNRLFLRGYGNRTSARVGKGREFDRMRDYVRGDEIRDVAWKTTARHGRLIVREYRLDRSQDIVVCLDTGHRMAARAGHLSRLDHAVNACMLLAYVCNRLEDRVGIVAFNAGVQPGVRPGSGMAHLREVTRFVTGVHPFYRHTDYLALAADLRRVARHRSLIFLMTVLPELEDHHDLVRAVRMLSSQHLVLITAFADVQLKAASEMLPAGKRELTNVIVARQLWESRLAVARELRDYGALVVDTPPEQFSVNSVNAYLEVKRRQLL